MNSYPPELLAQLAPVMFAAGLDEQKSAQAATTDPFTILTQRLRHALSSQRKLTIWQPEKTKLFTIVLVDKDVRFPPRKIVPNNDRESDASLMSNNPNLHSPLSPLTPSSPLYPDGLIAPIWIRKHTTLVPSVFVLFTRIFELASVSPKSPLDPPDAEQNKERETEERRKDTDLAAEIALRKKTTNERGIKLTVVLLASRRLLDDPSLDARLTFIRRQSGLDSRAALFVVSPVSPSELLEFVASLQQALWDPALEYYTNHSKRVRRKRNRHSQATSTMIMPMSPLGGASVNVLARPLRPEGWTVRYEYKMACFAEFRGEEEVALRHYQDAYSSLVIMFGSPAILPPRTKRWAEARVLSDSINIKICKLYLYNNEHALALSHHSTHMRKLGDFSRGWGIGEESFEYWSWMARQYRILAELLEQGTRTTLTIPSHKPAFPPVHQSFLPFTQALFIASLTNYRAPIPNTGLGGQGSLSQVELDALKAMGMNPSHALQHPGVYYFMAARCSELRKEKFQVAFDAESAQQPTINSPGYANEKKVDHLTIILELYTKSYELFKKYGPVNAQNQAQGRLTLWIAFRIAQTYYEAGKFDMAVRLFERIAKTYRKEQWSFMLSPLLSTWYVCVKRLGDVELSVRLLIELMGLENTGTEEPGALEQDLLAVLKSSHPNSPDEPFVIGDSESQAIFDSRVVFWSQDAKVDEPTSFQLTLTAPTHITISSLPISSLSIYFIGLDSPVVVQHQSDSTLADKFTVRQVALGHITLPPPGLQDGEETIHECQAHLVWSPGSSLVFSGTVSSPHPTQLRISKVVLGLTEGSWRIKIPFNPASPRKASNGTIKWLSSVDPIKFIPVENADYSSVSIRYRPHRLAVTISHQSPAYLDEKYPITIDITNGDERELDVVIDVLLQPSEVEDAVNSVSLDDEHSSGLIKGVALGTIRPGVNVLKTLYLTSGGAPGDRMIDISVQSRRSSAARPPSPPSASETRAQSPTSPQRELLDLGETLRTFVVPAVSPVKVTFDVSVQRIAGERMGLADLRSFEPGAWDDMLEIQAVVSSTVECTGPWTVHVDGFRYLRKDSEHARTTFHHSEEFEKDVIGEYEPGDCFSDRCIVNLIPPESQNFEQSVPGPGSYELLWRRVMPSGLLSPQCTSSFPLPNLEIPPDGLVALLHVPSTAKLHVPVVMELTIRNHHPTRTANVVVQLEPDPSDGFVVAGMRSGRVPILLPGTEEKLTWRLIPTLCGHIRPPLLKVFDKRKTATAVQSGGMPMVTQEGEGDAVKIVDVRWDIRKGTTQGRPETESERTFDVGTILVLA